MPESDPRPVLSRIIAAHRGTSARAAALEPGLRSGLTRAIRRAAMPFATLAPEVAEVSVRGEACLADGLAVMPAHGLTAAVEDAQGRRGLVVLDHPLVDALIEVQATGHVEDTDQPPREVTPIDEALCRDFIDLLLAAFGQETAEHPDRDWPERMRYGSNIADRAQLNLLMPDRGYRLLRTSVTLGGRKTGTVVVLLPCDSAISRRRTLASPDAAPQDWSAQMLFVLGAAPMPLDAVLKRFILPLGRVEAFGEGDLLPFDHDDLGAVTLEDDAGHVFARGALGQVSGKRAVRLRGAETAPSGPSEPRECSNVSPEASPAGGGPTQLPPAAVPEGAPPLSLSPTPSPTPSLTTGASPGRFDSNEYLGDAAPAPPLVAVQGHDGDAAHG